MLRVPLDKAYLKRTIRPLYGWTQATPKSTFLDPAFNRAKPIYPGMAMVQGSAADTVTLFTSSGQKPLGLSALYVGGDGIDEPLDAGVNAFAIWQLAPDAEFEILAPAFKADETWVNPGTGATVLVYAATGATTSLSGQLVPAGGTDAGSVPVARLIRVASASKIVIGGLFGTT